jgi:fatty-acyl-CoA synthase
MLQTLAPDWAAARAAAARLPQLRTVVDDWATRRTPGMLTLRPCCWPPGDRACRLPRAAALPRRHQHPVHQRHHRQPQGRHADAPQHRQQRLLRWRGMRLTEADRLCIPVPLYHCFGMVLGCWPASRTAQAWCSPARASTRWPRWQAVQDERCTALHGVPTMFIAELDHPRFHRFDLSHAAHRHHGRRALPDRGDEARGAARDAHARDHHRLRHDRDQPGVSFQSATDDPLDKRVSTVGRCSRTWR